MAQSNLQQARYQHNSVISLLLSVCMHWFNHDYHLGDNATHLNSIKFEFYHWYKSILNSLEGVENTHKRPHQQQTKDIWGHCRSVCPPAVSTRLTLRSLISSCCFNFSKKDWKKSVLSTCRGATHKASISAPVRRSNFDQCHLDWSAG